MFCLHITETIKHQMLKYLRHCLWGGSNIQKKGPTLVAWSKVCKQQTQGGIGIININVRNKALLLKILTSSSKDMPFSVSI
jgi:hypothetical protein